MTGDVAGRARGFTLIELILVIVVVGVLSFGTVQFIVNASQGYSNAARWERLGSTGRVAIERLAREVRNALPNSARAGTSAGGIPCLEYIPVLGGSSYLDIPTTVASAGFTSVPLFEPIATTRVAVYPIDTTETYTLAGSSAVISPPVATASSALVSTDVVTVEWAVSHAFPSESPTQRWYMVDEPVSFCVVGDRLFRYEGYGFSPAQPFPGQPAAVALPAAAPQRILIAGDLSLEGTAFEVLEATLQRNALVQFDLSFRQKGEGVRINHEVQLRNAP